MEYYQRKYFRIILMNLIFEDFNENVSIISILNLISTSNSENSQNSSVCFTFGPFGTRVYCHWKFSGNKFWIFGISINCVTLFSITNITPIYTTFIQGFVLDYLEHMIFITDFISEYKNRRIKIYWKFYFPVFLIKY